MRKRDRKFDPETTDPMSMILGLRLGFEVREEMNDEEGANETEKSLTAFFGKSIREIELALQPNESAVSALNWAKS